MPDQIDLLRHTLATIAYRGGKAMRDAPPGFSTFAASPGSRTPGQIQAHLCDLFDWALSIARGQQAWRDTVPLAWDQGTVRFFKALEALDSYLGSGAALGCTPEKLFQGPIADALTHIGQIAMLRRMAGAPIRGENYFVAEISAGRVGVQQPAPRREFD